jgi:hypothetical protein
MHSRGDRWVVAGCAAVLYLVSFALPAVKPLRPEYGALTFFRVDLFAAGRWRMRRASARIHRLACKSKIGDLNARYPKRVE